MYLIILILLFISVLLAVWSLSRQTKMDEIKSVRKALNKRRVIYDRSSSDKPSDL